MKRLPRWLSRVVQLVAVVGALWLAGRQLSGHWTQFRISAAGLEPRWTLLLASAACVLAGYAVLIHAWRTLVAEWGDPVPFWTAARVWTVGNLARFAPVSQLATTGAISLVGRQAGIRALAAGGSAVIGTLLNLGTGLVVLALTGTRLLTLARPDVPPLALVAIGVAGLVALPFVATPLVQLASRVLRRPVEMPRLGARALWIAVTMNVAAWFLYGLAFRLLTLAFFPDSGGGWIGYTAVFTFGYLFGWLFLPAPAGVGVREWALTSALTTLGLLAPVPAAIVVFTSRLVLTVLEIAPGVAFLVRGALSRTASPRDVSP